MKKFFLRNAVVLLIAVILFFCETKPASADTVQYIPYESYTYWENIAGSERKAVKNRPMYTVETVISADSIGIQPFSELTDVCVDSSGNIYILDKQSRIIILDRDYKLIKEIRTVEGDETYEFVGAKNLYVHSDGTIFICDTENKRVLHCNTDGICLNVIFLPDSPLIPDDFDFKPIKIAVDSRGYLYVLSEGSYYGALLYEPDGKTFMGFYGSNLVKNSIIGAFSGLLDRMFPNNEKAGNSQRALPYCFSDIIIDDSDFVYTATDGTRKEQIKKLRPGDGRNILNSDDISFSDDQMNRTYIMGYDYTQRIIGLDVDEQGFIYCLDASYGRIYVYDSKCRMITAFGGGMKTGTQKGMFVNAIAIAVQGSNVIAADSGNNLLTIFSRNDFGNKVHNLVTQTLDGDYIASKTGWEEVLASDKNLQVAYNGLARSYLAENNYEKAMEIALQGYDRETYSLAFEYYRSKWVSDNFAVLFTAAIVLLVCILAVVIFIKKKKFMIKNGKLKLAFQTLTHPAYAFEEIKEKNSGSVLYSLVILSVFYVTAVMQVICGGFIFTNYDPGTFNSLWTFVQSAGIVILFTVSNWLICSLMDGKGSFKEIFVVVCYSLVPIIVYRILWIFLSHILLPSESGFMNIMFAVAIIYTALLLITGMLKIHDFTMGKLFGTSILSVIGMAAILFFLILIGILLQQFGGFIVTLFVESLM